MRKSRFTEEQIIAILKEHEAGAKAEDLCRRHGISGTTFYKWKAKFGGLDVSEARRLRAVEDENRRLKKLLPSKCWTMRRSRTWSEKTSDASGASCGGSDCCRASWTVAAARHEASGSGSLRGALPQEAPG